MALDLNLRFNWKFLVDLLVAAILVLFFLFYFNRLFGKLVFSVVRKYTWYRYKTHIDVQALQISLLGGRIFFQGLRYYGNNQTIRVNAGHVTWRYWLRKVRDVDLQRFNGPAAGDDGRTRPQRRYVSLGEKGGVDSASDLSCRIAVSLQGFEWFVYNRSPAYDYVMEEMKRQVRTPPKPGTSPAEKDSSKDSESTKMPASLPSGRRATVEKLFAHLPTPAIARLVNRASLYNGHSTTKTGASQDADGRSARSDAGSDVSVDQSVADDEIPMSLLLRLLPIHVECSRGGIVLGNENTKGLLIVEFAKAKGDIDAGPSLPLDQYRQLINFQFSKPKIHIKSNPDYRENQSASAARNKGGRARHGRSNRVYSMFGYFKRQGHRVSRRVKEFLPASGRSTISLNNKSLDDKDTVDRSESHDTNNANQWMGLSRYLDVADRIQQDHWGQLEYADRELVLDSPMARMSFYWDESGVVRTSPKSDTSDINNSPPPAWGLDLAVNGGTISYGPWADRYRADLQSVFFPQLRKDAEPAIALKVGERRRSTVFKVFVEIDDTTTLHIPVRESSKDWKWKGRVDAAKGSQQNIGRRKKSKTASKSNRKGPTTSESRPYAWIDVKVAKDTTINYLTDMFPGPKGWSNKLDLDLRGIEVSSSVNHGLLLRSSLASAGCDLSSPLKWAALHKWHFDITSDGLEVFLLRDHIFLMTDLVTDWASGPLPNYFTFTPFQYALSVNLSDFKLHLNVNDSNIINDPSDFDDNVFLTVHGSGLKAEVGIPVDKYRPSHNEVSFSVSAHTGGLDLGVPPWNTYAAFLYSKHVALLNELTVSGSYNYFTQTAPHLTDTLLIDIHGATLALDLHGFLVKYLLKIKENYFGEDMHFKTFEEHQNQLPDLESGKPRIPPEELNYHKSNDLDVILFGGASNASVMLPSRLYTPREHIRIDLAEFAIELRFTSYFMDLQLDCSPFSVSCGAGGDGVLTPESTLSNVQLFIDGGNIYGHRLFGLPPTEPTYLCNWDIAIGTILGEVYPDFLRKALFAVRNFAFCFSDEENSIEPHPSATIYDVTYLKANIQPVKVWIRSEDSAFLVQTDSLDVEYDDLAGSNFSDRLSLQAPYLAVACVDSEAASRHRHRKRTTVDTHALLVTSIDLCMSQRTPFFKETRTRQRAHMRREDQRTHRIPFLLQPSYGDVGPTVESYHLHPAAMPFPPVPRPLLGEGKETEQAAKQTTILDRSYSESLYDTSQSTKNATGLAASHRSSSQYTAPNFDDSLHSRTPAETQPLRSHSPDPSKRDHSPFDQRSFRLAPANASSRPNASFSSTFTAPYFSLQNLEPDATNLPSVADSESVNWPNLQNPETKDRFSDEPESAAYTGIMIRFPNGIRGFCMPNAISALSALASQLQPVSPGEVLDKLQVDTVSAVLQSSKPKSSSPSCLEVTAVIPFISFKLFYILPDDPLDAKICRRDEYNLSIDSITVSLRSREMAQTTDLTHGRNASSMSFHLAFQELGIAARETAGFALESDAFAQIKLAGCEVWAAKSNTGTQAGARCRKLDLITGRETAILLANQVHRTKMALDAATLASLNLDLSLQSRLEYLVSSLLSSKQDSGDPPFLLRPSHILRPTPGHLRAKDSWRMVMRLRQLLYNLDSERNRQLNLLFALSAAEAPAVDSQELLQTFSAWGGQDFENVRSSVVARIVFGASIGPKQLPVASDPLEITVDLGGFHFMIDPGPRQNEIVVGGFSLTTAVRSTVSFSDASHQKSITSIKILSEVHCNNAAIRFNWDLCELVEGIAKAFVTDFGKPATDHSPSPSASAPAESSTSKMDQLINLQLIVAIDSGSVTVDGINIKAIVAGKDMAMLTTVQTGPAEGNFKLSVLCHSQASNYELVGRSQLLAFSKLRQPSLSCNIDRMTKGEKSEIAVKVAASSQHFVYEVRQEAVLVLETLDLVLKDEIRQLLMLSRRVSALSTAKTQPNGGTSPRQSQNTFHMSAALFLHAYKLRVELLPTLQYVISGNIARLSCSPISNNGHMLDFDLKGHSHDVQSASSGKLRSVSLLKMPPINGRVTVRTSKEETFVQVLTSVESIKLDAAAVNSLVNAIHRPQVAKTIEDVRSEIDNLTTHATQIFGHDSTQKAPPLNQQAKEKDTSLFIYDVRLTAAGLGVHATAPGLLRRDNAAELDFVFGLLRLKATNRLKKDSGILKFPEIRLGLQQISFELTRAGGRDRQPCGNLHFEAHALCTSKLNEADALVRAYHIKSGSLEVNLFADTASTILDVIGNLQDRIKDFDLSREVKYLQKIGQRRLKRSIKLPEISDSARVPEEPAPQQLFSSMYSLELLDVQICWLIGESIPMSPGREVEDLVLSLAKIDLATKRQTAARLAIGDLRLQMVARSQNKRMRSSNSALLPEVIFNVAYLSTKDERRLAFQAAGKSLDLRLTSDSILPASDIEKSIASAAQKLRNASATWSAKSTETGAERKKVLGTKRLGSLLVDADFAGAVVYIEGRRQRATDLDAFTAVKGARPQQGRYGQFIPEKSNTQTVMRAPGIAFKVEYKDNGLEDPSLNAEIRVDASTNILYPAVVPLIIEMSSSIKEIVSDTNDVQTKSVRAPSQGFLEDENILRVDPTTLWGRAKLNIGLRICRQEFSLSCQPLARVAAMAKFDDIYITINTVKSPDLGKFFAISAVISQMQVSVQHDYSRDSTASFEVESVVLSLMNSKHVSGVSGVSAILNISPMKARINAKQLQDFLLFREIWLPEEVRHGSNPSPQRSDGEPQTYLVQRYQQVAATGAFPWNATVAISEIEVLMDLGQSLGKPAFKIIDFWISSKKTSDWEQNLCVSFKEVAIKSSGRLSGFVELQNLKARTSIQWPSRQEALAETPLIQASLGFERFRAKISFDYQGFLIADIASFEFLMYNVRDKLKSRSDRLVGVLNGDKVQVFVTTGVSSQGLALYQAVDRLIQEKKLAFEMALKDLEKFLHRKSVVPGYLLQHHLSEPAQRPEDTIGRKPVLLHTDVVVTLNQVNLGAYPSTFYDRQILKVEALNARARFAVKMEQGKLHSGLGLTLGELRVALSGVKRPNVPKSLADIDVDEIITESMSSRGGIILRVPQVIASMQTWQELDSNRIDYIFKSSFEGKVDVGWNYSRISFIRGMWENHSKSLAQRLGKPLPQSALQITGAPKPNPIGSELEFDKVREGEQEKITAVVNVPQSRYEYKPLEPAVIETPQLRDMGEATPPLEWIGLHRDRLPNLTHQIVIVTLLEVAKEVEDAYSKILGTS
ncbi:MAG: hypothetical protein M1814_003447 [Vezdaea aestivalis]|nr:MAG: hypothetical protein M1814_003447 [Vezdaea aestivalis]